MLSIHFKITYHVITTSKVQPNIFFHIQNRILHIRFSLIECNQWQDEPGFGTGSHCTDTMESPGWWNLDSGLPWMLRTVSNFTTLDFCLGWGVDVITSRATRSVYIGEFILHVHIQDRTIKSWKLI